MSYYVALILTIVGLRVLRHSITTPNPQALAGALLVGVAGICFGWHMRATRGAR